MTTKGTILVTGGAGFIGSHTCVELLNGGYDVVVIDNLVNSKRESLRRVEQITGRTVGMLKILFHRESLQILGIHCFGANGRRRLPQAADTNTKQPLDAG